MILNVIIWFVAVACIAFGDLFNQYSLLFKFFSSATLGYFFGKYCEMNAYKRCWKVLEKTLDEKGVK